MNNCHKRESYEYFQNLRFGKKAQYSRIDLLAWYGLCLFVVMIAVGALYSLNFIGSDFGSSGQITAAVVVDNYFEEESVLEINNSVDENPLQDSND